MLYKKEPIIGYEEYQIDTDGNVYNKNGTLKVVSKNKRGYYIVTLCVNGKLRYFSVHVLVARQFIPNPENLPQVNHKDGNRINNNVDNLEWCTAKQNARHSFDILKRVPSGKKPIIGVDVETLEIKYVFDSLAEAGRFFANGKNYRRCQNSVWRVLTGVRSTYKGCIWKYISKDQYEEYKNKNSR